MKDVSRETLLFWITISTLTLFVIKAFFTPASFGPYFMIVLLFYALFAQVHLANADHKRENIDAEKAEIKKALEQINSFKDRIGKIEVALSFSKGKL